MSTSKCKCLLPVALLCIGVAVLYVSLRPKPASVHSDLGVSAYLIACAPKDNHKPECASVEGIQRNYKFDLMSEIKTEYQKMQKTAADIAAGRLTDEDYQVCLANGTCASVPMLGKNDDPKSRHGKKISKAFWYLADGHALDVEMCGLIQICDIGLRNGALEISKDKTITVKARKS